MRVGDVPDITNRIAGGSNLRGSVKQADIVIENLAESEGVRENTFTQLDEYCDKNAILSSDTPTMNIFSFLEVFRPERLVIVHLFNPTHVVSLVEFVRGPEASDKMAGATKYFLEDTSK